MDDGVVARLLSQVEPQGRDALRRLMRAEQTQRDEFALALLRQQTQAARGLADLVDLASLHPEIRRQVARVLGALSV